MLHKPPGLHLSVCLFTMTSCDDPDAVSSAVAQVPSDISWMVNEGRLAPVVDVVQALRDEAAGAGNKAKGAAWKGSGGAEDAAKGGGNKGFAKKDVSRYHTRCRHRLPASVRRYGQREIRC